ncbi:MAG: hypothetical protein ABI091_26760 [Ferruginibacter sp.]
MISKKLKYTKTITIGEHEFEKPDLPKSNSDILFYDSEEEGAFWLRLELPKVFYDFSPNYTELYSEATLPDGNGLYKSFNVEDSDLFVATLKQELDRRMNGLFFRNGNEIEWITGDHYFMLEHCKVFGKDTRYDKFCKVFGKIVDENTYTKMYLEYGYFFKYQRDVYYLIQKVKLDDEILGLYLSKAKKTGITFLFQCYKLNRTTLIKMLEIAVMSKTQPDAIDTNFKFYLYAFEGLPQIFKPVVQSFARKDGYITFGAKAFTGTSSSKAAVSRVSHDKALNSTVRTVSTDLKSLDGPKWTDIELDEFNKTFAQSNVSPQGIFEVATAACKMQNDITAKLWIFGYVSEDNDRGVDEARIIYFDSKLSTKKYANGFRKRTKSELICFHVSSLNAYLSLHDKYGSCDQKEANRIIEEELLKVKDKPKAYQAKKKQLARNEKDAWSVGGVQSTYNILELTSRQVALEEELRNTPSNIGVLGELRWENEYWETGRKNKRPKGKFCKVRFVPLSEDDLLDGKQGKILMYKLLHPTKQNIALNFGEDDYGNLLPPQRFEFLGGIDPTQYAGGKEVTEGSKNASYTMNFHDEGINQRMRQIETKVLISKYFYRPDSPNEAYEDFLKEIIYFGKLCVVEANAPHVAQMLMEEGLGYYMIIKNKKENSFTRWKPYMKPGEDYNLIRRASNASQDDLMEYMVRLVTNYIEVFKDETNYLDTIMDSELIGQLINFDPKETRTSDLAMAFKYTLLCYDVYYNSLLMEYDEYNNPSTIESVLRAIAV